MDEPRRLNLILDHVDSAPEYLPDVAVEADEHGVFRLGSETWRMTDRSGMLLGKPGTTAWVVCEPAGTGVSERRS